MKNKSNFLYFGTGLIILALFITLIFQKNTLTNNLTELERLSEKHTQYQFKRDQVEGKFLWETDLLTEKTFDSLLTDKKFNTPHLFFLYDSLGCQKCYDFHKRYLLSEKFSENSTILYNAEFKFLLADFRKLNILNFEEYKKIPSRQFAVLVDTNGRILRGDFLEFEDLELSEKFYQFAAKIVR